MHEFKKVGNNSRFFRIPAGFLAALVTAHNGAAIGARLLSCAVGFPGVSLDDFDL